MCFMVDVCAKKNIGTQIQPKSYLNTVRYPHGVGDSLTLDQRKFPSSGTKRSNFVDGAAKWEKINENK